jgi:hypothetical protein
MDSLNSAFSHHRMVSSIKILKDKSCSICYHGLPFHAARMKALAKRSETSS